jgi:hypothetical protein
MQHRECASQAKALGIARIYARNEGTYEPVEQLGGKFPANERPHGFVLLGSTTVAE